MRDSGNTYIHFIEEDGDCILSKRLVHSVPRVDDEIRIGGEGKALFYKVTRVVWIYDEPDNPFERVNIGLIKA
jgi:hypothetical protein